jgi:PhnB protein
MVLIVEDPEGVFQRAVAAGAKVVSPVSDGHGWRVGRIVDPFGHHWEIGKPLAKRIRWSAGDAADGSANSRQMGR